MILITGGTGFVGRHLIAELLKKSYKVKCLSRDPAKAVSILKEGSEFVKGDVTDKASVLGAIGPDVEAVVHLVGILVEAGGETYRKSHVEGTRNVVEACMEKGVKRYLHISALGTRENARSDYHKTKWEAEELIRSSSLDYTIFRPSVIFGKGDRFTNTFASLIKLSPVILIPGNGKNKMQPVFAADLAGAMTASIKRPDTIGETYDAAGPDILTFDEIIDRISEVLGKKRIKVHGPMPLMRVNAILMERFMSNPPFTRGSLIMLEEDNITFNNSLPKVFGISPAGFVEGMKTYLH
ncbi:MAG: complex I NDUFA9 subunit family protein [Deltaproteobacteria bacterium]|nr:complex I NDUFA9 subunit family protein [Deltaproteobacteria bacterium]